MKVRRDIFPALANLSKGPLSASSKVPPWNYGTLDSKSQPQKPTKRPESMILEILNRTEGGCSKTVFKRVSSGFMSYKTFLCV